jgi:hypothetical protein
VKRETHTAHRLLVTPGVDDGARIRRIGIETPHHRKALGLRACRCNHHIVARALEHWRDQHRTIHACHIHLAPQIIGRDRLRLVRSRQVWSGGRPRPLWRMHRPDMYLRIDNQHDSTAIKESAEFKDGRASVHAPCDM